VDPLKKFGTLEQSEAEAYVARLIKAIDSVNPVLNNFNDWDCDLIFDALKVGSSKMQSIGFYTLLRRNKKVLLSFSNLPHAVSLELKLHMIELLNDPRCTQRDIFDNRIIAINFYREHWQDISSRFLANSISDIPHPINILANGYWGGSANSANADLILMAQLWRNSGYTNLKMIRGTEFIQRQYTDSRTAIIGTIHKEVIFKREQLMKRLEDRNIIYLKDIFSDNEIRFDATQRVKDQWIGFFKYPLWMRSEIRSFLLDKVSHDEFSRASVYAFSVTPLRDFLYETFTNPSPKDITAELIDSMFLDWGNEKKLAGKNWWTDAARVIEYAGRKWPQKWPSLSFSSRSARKIKKRQCVEVGGRLHKSKEGAGRSTPKDIVEKISAIIKQAPDPIPLIFLLAISTGARRDDLHAIQYDCLFPDEDPNFMQLRFWQNKVRKWNIKPLLISDPAHKRIIDMIKIQQDRIVSLIGKKTLHLFPKFYGEKESYVSPSFTTTEIKYLCIKNKILNSDGGIFNFTWHPLRHYRGTEMALSGHDILSIMFELGHESPDMATSYVNHRTQIKKKALIAKGGGRFYDIQGVLDDKISILLQRKEDAAKVTRVCGGACTIPAQIGDWCEHANACFTCTYFRADSQDSEFFKSEALRLKALIFEQESTISELRKENKLRLSEIENRRLARNTEVLNNIHNIVAAIDSRGAYSGNERAYKASVQS